MTDGQDYHKLFAPIGMTSARRNVWSDPASLTYNPSKVSP